MRDKQEISDKLEEYQEKYGHRQSRYQRLKNTVFAGSIVLGTAALGAAIPWMVAPPVGGEFWPYIRVGVAALGAYVALHLLGIVVVLLATVVIDDIENIEKNI